MGRLPADGARARPRRPQASPSQLRALLIAVTLLLAIAVGAGWLVQRGVASSETWLPAPHASQRRVVTRAGRTGDVLARDRRLRRDGRRHRGTVRWLALEGARLRRSRRRTTEDRRMRPRRKSRRAALAALLFMTTLV